MSEEYARKKLNLFTFVIIRIHMQACESPFWAAIASQLAFVKRQAI